MNEAQNKALHDHLALVAKWGKHINLTTITDADAMWSHHVCDSLVIVPFLEGEHFIDIGTGAGFPGIPLAIAMPDKRFTLIDSNHKKIGFLNNVTAQLGLKNVQAKHSRIEDYQTDILADGIISRAVGNMTQMCSQSEHLLKNNGHFYWMKGQYPQEELKQLPFEAKVHKLEIPQLADEQRHLVIIKKLAQ